MKTLICSAAMFAAFAGSAAFAQVMSPAEYVKTAGASDLYERQSSEIVLQSTQDQKVKAFAQMMVDDHGKSTEAVKTAASGAKVPPASPMLTPLQSELIAELKAEKGASRDAAYIAQQKAAHGQALAVQKAYATDGTAAPLKAAAASIVPVVEHHIQMLMGM